MNVVLNLHGVGDEAGKSLAFFHRRGDPHGFLCLDVPDEDFGNENLETIYRMRQYSKEQTFPMNLSACGNYGGCEFRALCSRTPSVREKFLVGDYSAEAPWDPAKSR